MSDSPAPPSSRRAFRARGVFVLLASVAIGVGIACGTTGESSEFPDTSACGSIYKGKCGLPCTEDKDCAQGLFCATDGKCFAECGPGAPPCVSGVQCTGFGRCGDGPPSIIGNSDTGPAPDAPIGDSCADIELTVAKTKPTVLLLVDQSGSMTQQFPPGSGLQRWDVLRDALMAADGGVIKPLENDVAFGLTLYTWPTGPTTCPRLVSAPTTQLGNHAAMNTLYQDAAPIDNTPTAESIMGVIGFDDAGTLRDGGFASLSTPGPKILLLATDGDPDTCAAPNSNGTQPPRDFTVWAARRTFDAGIKTYVISIGADIDQAHQQQVANVGLGFNADAGDAAPLFRTNDRQQVIDALNQIILGVRSCKFTLNGTVIPGTEAQGIVKLNGANLGFNDPNGWKLLSANEIEMVGTACTTVKTVVNAQVSVRFPCGTVVTK